MHRRHYITICSKKKHMYASENNCDANRFLHFNLCKLHFPHLRVSENVRRDDVCEKALNVHSLNSYGDVVQQPAIKASLSAWKTCTSLYLLEGSGQMPWCPLIIFRMMIRFMRKQITVACSWDLVSVKLPRDSGQQPLSMWNFLINKWW